MKGLPAEAIQHFDRAELLFKRGDYALAAKEFKRAIKHAPDFWLLHMNLGCAYYKCGDLKNACTALARAVELHPESKDAQYNLGLVLGRLERYDEADKHMAKAAYMGSEEAKEVLAKMSMATCKGCGEPVENVHVPDTPIVFAAEVPWKCGSCGVFCAKCVDKSQKGLVLGALCPKCNREMQVFGSYFLWSLAIGSSSCLLLDQFIQKRFGCAHLREDCGGITGLVSC